MSNLVIVSMHEKGFPQADFYRDQGETDPIEFNNMGLSPDEFFTMAKGDAIEAAFERATSKYPGSVVVYADEDQTGEDVY